MSHNLDKPLADQNLFSDILGEAGRQKIKLTPEITEEIREHLAEAQARAERGEPMTREMAEFMENVRLWVGMPEWWREENPKLTNESVLEMNRLVTDEVREEAKKRDISVGQWLDLLHVSEAQKDKNVTRGCGASFQFPGKGKIKAEWGLILSRWQSLLRLPEGLEVGKNLELVDCTNFTHLPKGLRVDGELNLSGCTNLTELPEGLKVEKNIYLINCKNLIALPKDLIEANESLWLDGSTRLTELPEGLRVGGSLSLRACSGLTSLPKGLEIKKDLDIRQCEKITQLPEDLRVGGTLFLSEYPNIKRDVERLKQKGNTKIKIEYV